MFNGSTLVITFNSGIGFYSMFDGLPMHLFSIHSLFFDLSHQRLLTGQMVFDGVLLSAARQPHPINLPFVFVHTRGSAYVDGPDWPIGGLAHVPANSQSR